LHSFSTFIHYCFSCLVHPTLNQVIRRNQCILSLPSFIAVLVVISRPTLNQVNRRNQCILSLPSFITVLVVIVFTTISNANEHSENQNVPSDPLFSSSYNLLCKLTAISTHQQVYSSKHRTYILLLFNLSLKFSGIQSPNSVNNSCCIIMWYCIYHAYIPSLFLSKMHK